MKHQVIRKPLAAILPVMLLVAFAGCSRKEPEPAIKEAHDSSQHGESAEAKQLYQCSMHPNIVSDKPGKCPICGMELQPVRPVNVEGISGRAAVELTDAQRQLINIRTVRVRSRQVERTVRAAGVVTYDQTRVADITSRVSGWVEKLYVDKPGELVKQGEPLIDLYSPDLYSAKQDYLLAYKNASRAKKGGGTTEFGESRVAGAEAVVESARKRLELFGVAPNQIQALEKSGSAKSTMAILAPLKGTVVEKNVVQGKMIQPSTPLYRIADLSRVWVEAEIYEYELPLVRVGQEAAVTVTSYPDRTFTGRVDFIYPYLRGETRTVKIRVVLDNPEGLLKPDMYATVEVHPDLGEALVAPASAIFDTGRRQYVFLDHGEGLFVPAEVELGPKVGDDFVVRKGVNEGQRVVVNGNFLLDSESQLKAAAGGKSEEAGHGEQAPAGKVAEVQAPLPAEATPLFKTLVGSYLGIQDLLARDRIEGVNPLIGQMQAELGRIADSSVEPSRNASSYRARLGELKTALDAFKPDTLEAARLQFSNVSHELIALLGNFPPSLDQKLYVFECPMWEKSNARWIQAKSEVENPFMGQAMPHCGDLISETGPENTR